MTRIEFNLNCVIHVRLTEHGKEVYADYVDNTNRELLGESKKRYWHPLQRQCDSEGYTSFQLWEFCKIFGQHFSPGLPVVCDMNVYFTD